MQRANAPPLSGVLSGYWSTDAVTRAMKLAGMVAIAMATNVVCADTVFRSVDENGQVIYSDRPNTELPNEAVYLSIQRSNTSQIAAKKSSDEEIAAAAKIREDQEAGDVAEQEELQAKVAAERQTNCERAKTRQEKYNTNRKLYRPQANGEREYLSDDEIDAARAEAASTVAEWCS